MLEKPIIFLLKPLGIRLKIAKKHVPTDQERAEAKRVCEENRKIRQETRRLELDIARQKLENSLMHKQILKKDLELDLNGEEQEEHSDPAQDFFGTLAQVISAGNQNASIPHIKEGSPTPETPQAAVQVQSGLISLSDDEIRSLIGQFTPKQIASFKQLPHDLQVKLIKTKGNFNDQTIERALSLI